MNRYRARSKRPISLRPICETLEGRALLSAINLPSGLGTALIGGIGRNLGGIKTDPAGVAAVTSALRGGPGSEFVTLIRRQVPNIGALVRRFATGATTATSVPGAAVQIPRFQDQFTGRHYDHLATTVAGAVLLPGNTLELGAIVRGPFDEPVPAYVVFGIDRGSGASLGPAFSARPGLTPDALVTITVAPFGKGGTGTITDLKTGAVTSIDPSRIQVNGATLRVFLDTAQLPSTGLPAAKYRFAMWTRSQLDGGIENVASFLPDTSMIPIGVNRGRGGRR
jgi:hypothetical protein